MDQQIGLYSLFSFLSSFLPFGIAIIIMTIIVRLAMSPVTYKSYVSQIKMKVLKPEVDEITKKYKDDAVLSARNHGVVQ